MTRITKQQIIPIYQKIQQIKKEVAKAVVGQETIVDGIIRGLLADGHILIEGIPGIAKTLIARAIATTIRCDFNRIQFTVDLLPTDITGITAYDKNRGFYTVKGPIFARIVMADEINRAPPKTQSALLEAMQENQVTIGKKTYGIGKPFFVIATENSFESAGTYPLPDAQTDRFLFKVLIDYPNEKEEKLILDTNITLAKFEDFKIKGVISANDINRFQKIVQNFYTEEKIKDYLVRIVSTTRNTEKVDLKYGRYIQQGASPRASIGLYIASKAEAVLRGHSYVTPQHVKNVAADILRHRIRLTYEAQAEGITPEVVIQDILAKVKVP